MSFLHSIMLCTYELIYCSECCGNYCCVLYIVQDDLETCPPGNLISLHAWHSHMDAILVTYYS